MIRQWLNRLVLVLGTGALILAIVLTVAPTALVPLIEPTAVETVLASTVGLLTISAALLLGGSIAVWKGRQPIEQETDALYDEDQPLPDESSASRVRMFDETLKTAVVTSDPSRRDEVREELRSVAIRTVSTAENRSPADVREDVLAGGWTDDRVVAAFLGDASAPRTPLRWRLYAWLYDGQAFRQSVDRTLEAIEAYQGEQP